MTFPTIFLIAAALMLAGALACRVCQEFAPARARKRLRLGMNLLLIVAAGMALKACVAGVA